jgi:hypothetical protein
MRESLARSDDRAVPLMLALVGAGVRYVRHSRSPSGRSERLAGRAGRLRDSWR